MLGKRLSNKPQTATPTAAFTGPGLHHGIRQFVLRASALRPSALIRGAPVRRHPAKLSLERLGSAFAQLWEQVPLSCVRAAETTLVSGFIPSRGPLRSWIPPEREPCPAGARPHFRCSFCSPCSAPVQSGLPVGTSSCSTRDGLLSEHNHGDRNGGRVNGGALWKLLTSLLINGSRTCERPNASANGGRDTWRSIWRHGSS